MNISLTWTELKTQITNKAKIRFNERDDFYNIYYGDFETSILKDTGADQTDFETNYKSFANKPVTETVEVTKLAESQPFAIPAYRTKMNATSSTISIAPNTDTNISFMLTAERYVTGGSMVIKNAQVGDYIVATVEDTNGVIPSEYRTALCEAWPIVSSYIEKRYIEITGNVSTDGNSCTMKISTYPLNAKISAGLFLCIHYYATNAGYTRELAVNYDLTKKL